ncbi:type VI secretion system baseplate subunit TssF [Pseudomonas sp. RIT-PI-AD]|uniref:type VI secretion system baseplate subunit TssF n=1 Tax=Pseudomonas sp. RIT-PI-AD TaxID=3035294 RepID=UPI0021D9480D|nr:type VI secretion system baseplate subunit TssF [Pseudomonas sp. RIT-PI-AD]
MDPRLLTYYNNELGYLRELGAEFAGHYPKVAARLGMQGMEVADPYVERLLEGFCFLTARVQLKMDAEFPRFSQRLLEVIYPNYLAPTPAMCIVQFAPGEMTGNQSGGFTIPRDTRLKEPPQSERKTQCEFRTAHEVELWPLRLSSAKFESAPADIRLNRASLKRPVKSALHLRFDFTVSSSGKAPDPDRLSLHLRGGHLASRLYELLCAHSLGVAVRAVGAERSEWHTLPAEALRPEGLSDEQALLPYSIRGFQGYRLLHEYFAFPSRYHFVALEGLRPALASARDVRGFEVVVLLDCETADFESVVDAGNFALFCTPAVNLISMRSDRVPITDSRFEFHAVPDRARPMDYEVYSVQSAEGFGRDNAVEAEFRPFYSCIAGDRGNHGAYFSVRREPRLPSDTILRKGARSTYLGSEVFLSLVDQHDAPYSRNLRQLGVDMTVTNRDLPLLVSVGGEQDLIPLNSLPVSAVRILQGPSRPVPAAPEGELTWRLISHLGLTYQTLTEQTPEQGAQALRELLALYTSLGDPAVARHAQALLKTELKPVTRRLPGAGPLTFGRGVAIDVTVDESQFAGTSPYLFGTILEQYLARHVSLNTFTELRLHSAQRGAIGHWPPRFGTRPVA